MKLREINEWLQVLGNFAILLGLFFLIAELRQNANIARAELVVSVSLDLRSVNQIQSSDAYAKAYANMLRNEGPLSLEDQVVLDRVLTQVVDVIALEDYLQFLGVVETDDNVITGLVPQFFGNRYAQAWWPIAKLRWWPEFATRMDNEIGKVSENVDSEFFSELSKDLNEEN